jgi:hypothetical protein
MIVPFVLMILPKFLPCNRLASSDLPEAGKKRHSFILILPFVLMILLFVFLNCRRPFLVTGFVVLNHPNAILTSPCSS